MDIAPGRPILLSPALLALALLAGCGEDDEGLANDRISDRLLRSFPCGASGSVARTELSLESLDLKQWLDRVSGRHEAALRWKPLYLTDRVGGFDELTTVSMDVTVLGASDYVYTPDANSECGAASRRSLDVEIQLATEDGAFGGSFRHTLRFFPGYAEATPRLDSSQGFSVELDRFARTFEMRMGPPLNGDPDSVGGFLQVFFSFQEDGIQGSLQPTFYAAPDANGYNRSHWLPVEGVFPYPCSEGEALDQVWEELGGTPRALYDEYVRHWPAVPLTARYVDPERFPSSRSPLAETQLSMNVGPLSKICDTPDFGLRFFGPLSLETSDGRVRFAQEMETDLVTQESKVESPHIPAAELERALDVASVDLRTATHGRVRIENRFSVDHSGSAGCSEMFGNLSITPTGGFDPQRASPALVWYTALGCGPDPAAP